MFQNQNFNPPDHPFARSSEAVSPRAQYGCADWVFRGQTGQVLTPDVDWDPFARFADPDTWLDVSSAYFYGNQFWLNSAMSSIEGILGTGEKDVYLVRPSYVSANKVRVTSLAPAGSSIVPRICLGPTSSVPSVPELCTNASTELSLPSYDVHVVVFNYEDYEFSRRGDTIPYRLELVN